MAIDINIPSQVKNYANLAAFPATGTLKTIFIAEDTNKTYRWTGSAYVEISATAASTWGAITGTLSNQTDLQTALNAKVTGNTAITGATKTKVTYDSKGLVTAGADATTADIADSTNKRYVTDANLTVIGNTSGTNTGDQTLSGLGGVPTSRTLTINGTTQDLSADRTFTISTGITIGTTAITSGTVGRVLFEGTGNVVSESANLFWDNTNARLGIGTSSPTADISVIKSSVAAGAVGIGARNNTATGEAYLSIYNDLGEYGALEIFGSTFASSSQQRKATFTSSGNNGFGIILYNSNSTANFSIFTGISQTERFRLFNATGNIVLQNGGTFTDAGFKLDVNGTARVGEMTFGTQTIANTGAYALTLNSSSALDLKSTGGNRFYMGYTSGGVTGTFLIASMYIGAAVPTFKPSARLEVDSTTQGFLPPRMTSAQRTAIGTPAVGLVVYQTDATEGLYVNKSTGWALLL